MMIRLEKLMFNNEDVVAAVDACEDENQAEEVVEDETKTAEKIDFN